MPELITLSTPVFATAGATRFRLWGLDMRRDHPDRPAGILALFREVDGAGAFIGGGRLIECRYEGAEANTLLIGLNKANLTIKSLEKRVTEQCQFDGKLGAGAISGAPD